MAKGIFITATGTDIGKTYVTGLLIKKLRLGGVSAGYYKAALSGVGSVAEFSENNGVYAEATEYPASGEATTEILENSESDEIYVNRIAAIGQAKETLCSYSYAPAVSPHLAARLYGNPPELSKIMQDYHNVRECYDYVTVEGSGGVVCPIRWDDRSHILLEDIIKEMQLNTIIVADAGLGTINAVTLTAEYLRNRGIGIKGVILNRYTGGFMQEDNIVMIEAIAKVPVLALVGKGAEEIELSVDKIKEIYEGCSFN
ncbi:ATP-dependent dethiobiotin synthetase BioD [Clostridia bacterium]|nr:ATP-dependent dethiobiotin synthetase BioD [Clostridia bacterium]